MRGFLGSAPLILTWIERTPHVSPTALQHVRVDHRSAYVFVPQEFLHRPNIVTILQQVRSKAVPERMATAALIETSLAYREFHRLLEYCFGKMMSAFSL